VADFDPNSFLAQQGAIFDPTEYLRTETLQERHGTPVEQAKAGLEGLAKGIAGPLAPLAEKALGVKSKAIREREEANPLTAKASELTGLVGGALTGTGEGALLTHIGEAVAPSARLGSAVLRGAVENALYQTGNETSKMILRDPSTSIGSAAANVGLASLLGGGVGGLAGAVNPLWQATVGKRLESFLGGIREKAGGMEGFDPFTHKSIEAPIGDVVKESSIDPFTHKPITVNRLPQNSLSETSKKAGFDPFTRKTIEESSLPQPSLTQETEQRLDPFTRKYTQEVINKDVATLDQKPSLTQEIGNALKEASPSPTDVLLALSGHPVPALLNIGRKLGSSLAGSDAIKASLGQFISTAKDINPAAFSRMSNVLNSAIQGDDLATEAVKSVFAKGALSQITVNKGDTKRLDQLLKHFEENPDQLMHGNDLLGHYLPDHATELGQLAATAISYLNNIRPRAGRNSPLDSEPVIAPAVKQPFDRALAVAEQPLTTIAAIKSGTLLPQDVQTLNALYPKLYVQLAQKLFTEMTEHLAGGKTIPYRVKQSLSLFAGHALDSTMMPQSIQAAQATFGSSPPPTQPKSAATGKAGALKGTIGASATPQQAKDLHRGEKG
jgi:hypothetical protein